MTLQPQSEPQAASQSHVASDYARPGAPERALTPIFRGIDWMARLGVLIALITTSFSVVMRYVFSNPVAWNHELSGYLIVFIVMLGAPLSLLQNRQIEVDILTGTLTGTALKIARIWAMLAVIVVSAVVLFSGWKMVLFSYDFGMLGEGHVEAPLWIPQGFMVCGFVFLLLAAALRFLSLMKD